MSERSPSNSDRLDLSADDQALIDAYFDRELSPETKPRLARRVASDAGAGLLFAETQAALDALRVPVPSADLSGAILDEVGRRRGWMDHRFQRFVSLGRLAVAAALLLALGLALAVQRLVPDAAFFPHAPSPIADVTGFAATDADCNLTGLIRTFDSAPLAAGFGSVMTSAPSASGALRGDRLSTAIAHPGALGANPGRPSDSAGGCGTGAVRVFIVRFSPSSNDCSLLTLSDRSRAGSVAFVHRSDAVTRTDDADRSAGGW